MIPEEGFPTFGGLSRSITFWGVPIIPLAFLLVGGALFALLAMLFIGGAGLLVLLIPIPIFFAMKALTANDNKALEIVGYDLLIFLKRKNTKIFNNTTTIVGTKMGRDTNDYIRFSKKRLESTDKPASSF